MAINAKEAPGGSTMQRDPMEPGTYPARVVQVVDLGLQPQQYMGEQKEPAREIMVTYEFLDEYMKDEEGNDIEDKPRWLSEWFPLRNLRAEKAKSTQRYKALDPNEVHEGDWAELLTVACLVSVVQNPGKGKNAGRVFENVAGVAVMRDKDAKKAPKLVNLPVFFDLDDPDLTIFNNLPDFIKDRIKSNLEYKGSVLERMLAEAGQNNQPAKSEEKFKEPKDDEDAPY